MINGVPRILMIRMGAIGDVVRCLPALHALRDTYPHGQIDWAITPEAAGLLEGHPALDRCLVLQDANNTTEFRAFCKQLRDSRYDIVVDFQGKEKSGAICRATKASKRYGFAKPRSQGMGLRAYTERVALPLSRMNRIEENLELCKILDAKRHHLEVVIQVDHDIQDDVDAWYEESFHGGKKVVAMHVPTAHESKQWPLKYFAALADMILADGRYEVTLTWGPGQREAVEQVERLCLRNPVIAPEMEDLKHYAWLVHRAGLYFGGDTGPMHIAAAMSTPVVAVFGGTDPVRHAPLLTSHTLLYKGPEPFPEKMTPEAAQLNLAAISPESAYDACVALLRGA